MQNNIEKILKKHPLIPVVTIHSEEEIDLVYEKLKGEGIRCIEITLRTEMSWKAIELFKKRYSNEFSVGVGTIISVQDIEKCAELKVDFMVSPGMTDTLITAFNQSGIPYLPGASTPSEIIHGIELGCKVLKFFPANLFGGMKALKTYKNVFQGIQFCPTGGVNIDNFKEYLALENVISVGGSWLTK